MSEENKVVDMLTRQPVKPDMPENVTVSQWMNLWKKYAKDNNAKTVAIIGIDENGDSFYDLIGVSEIELLRIYREIKNIKELIDYKLEPEYEIEDED